MTWVLAYLAFVKAAWKAAGRDLKNPRDLDSVERMG